MDGSVNVDHWIFCVLLHFMTKALFKRAILGMDVGPRALEWVVPGQYVDPLGGSYLMRLGNCITSVWRWLWYTAACHRCPR